MALDGLGHFPVNGVQLHCSDHTVLLKVKEKEEKKKVGGKIDMFKLLRIKDTGLNFRQCVCMCM